jgi:DNA-binding MarR family transcriptional regulator
MQVHSNRDPAAELDDLIDDALPDRRGLAAWFAFLRAHSSLMRELSIDLVMKTRLPLGDFDALFQLAHAGGELRMTDLAARTYSSRSAMTRRVDRLVVEGLVGRSNSADDGRGVVIVLSETGLTRLREALPVHVKGVSKLFLEQLDDEELAVLERALQKVGVNCSFG